MKMPRLTKKAHNIIILALLAVAVGCGTYLLCFYADARNNMQEMRRLAPSVAASLPAGSALPSEIVSSSVSSSTGMLPEFRTLSSQNADVVGWLKIEHTNINYPVMFTPNDVEFYLHRNFNKQEESRGLPFLDGATDLNASPNYLIYGHNMKDGTIFADLVKYRSQSFWREHPVICFDTLYEEGKYQILAAFNSKVYLQNENVFKYYQFSRPAAEDQYNDYIANVKKLSLYDTGITARYGERLLTLSTCSNYTEDGRFAVVAKKIGK